MASNLGCVGLAVADESELGRLIDRVRGAARPAGRFDGVEVFRWHDPSGAGLVLGVRDRDVADLLPVFASTAGGLVADCSLVKRRTRAWPARSCGPATVAVSSPGKGSASRPCGPWASRPTSAWPTPSTRPHPSPAASSPAPSSSPPSSTVRRSDKRKTSGCYLTLSLPVNEQREIGGQTGWQVLRNRHLVVRIGGVWVGRR